MSLAVTAGCYELPGFEAGECGNGIIDTGEDCDVRPAQGHPETLACSEECRYSCDRENTSTCPAGWGCGLDGVCRHGSGQFALEGPFSFPSTRLRTGDLDGDGRAEVVGVDGVVTGILSYDGGLIVSRDLLGGQQTVGDLDGDGRSTLVTSSVRQVSGWNWDAGQRLRPVLTVEQIPWAIQPEPGSRAIALRTSASINPQYALYLLKAANGLVLGAFGSPTVVTYPSVQGELTALTPRIAVGNVDLDADDEFAVAFRGGVDVFVFASACAPGACRVSLPPGSTVAGATDFADVNDDGIPDLVIEVEGGGAAVAEGNGDGTFSGAVRDARFDVVLVPPQLCALGGADGFVGGPPLLAADLDGDGRTDYVTATGIQTARGLPGSFCSLARGVEVTHAAQVDINGDGRLDVGWIEDGVLSIMTNAGVVYDRRQIELGSGAIPIGLMSGEYDANYVDDLVVLTSSTIGGPVDGVWIVYGSNDLNLLTAVPGPDLGRLGSVVTGEVSNPAASTDDLIFFGEDDEVGYVLALATSTPRGFNSGLGLDEDDIIDVAIGQFMTTGDEDGLHNDLMVVTSDELLVWPEQRATLRSWGKVVAPAPSLFVDGIRFFGDLDGNGVTDIGAVAEGVDGSVEISVYAVAGAAEPGVLLTDSLTGVSAPRSASLVDLDGDGALDLLLAFAEGGVRVFLDVRGGAAPITLTTAPVHAAVAVNVDDDPALEVMTLADPVRIYDLDAALSWNEVGEVADVLPDGGSTGAVVAGDLDGDGIQDLLVGISPDTAVVLWGRTNIAVLP